MRTFKKDSLEARILEAVAEQYPVTAEGLRKRVKARGFDAALKNLLREGYIVLDELPDRKYVRPTGRGKVTLGVKADQRKKLKRGSGRKTGEYGGPMYR